VAFQKRMQALEIRLTSVSPFARAPPQYISIYIYTVYTSLYLVPNFDKRPDRYKLTVLGVNSQNRSLIPAPCSTQPGQGTTAVAIRWPAKPLSRLLRNRPIFVILYIYFLIFFAPYAFWTLTHF